MTIDNYVLTKCIGKGNYAEVFLSKKLGSPETFATKRISKKKIQDMKKYLINEISILKNLNHPNIVHIEDVRQTKSHYYIMMEYINGGGLMENLQKYISMYHHPFTEEIIQHFMRQIVDAVKYLHKLRIVHRDLKLDNILLNFRNEEDKFNLNLLKATVKIIDFGFAIYLSKDGFAYSALGSPMNMDPLILNEMVSDSNALKGYTDKVDIWSLGTMCYEMLIGRAPFFAKTMNSLVKNVELGTYNLPLNISKEIVSFLNAMMKYDSRKRLSANQLSRHHFLVKNVKEFTPINLSRVINKHDGQSFQVNIKKNPTIWEIFNEENEEILNNINPNLLTPATSMDENIYVDYSNFFINQNPFDFDKLPIKIEENYSDETFNNYIQSPQQYSRAITYNPPIPQIYASVNNAINNNNNYGYNFQNNSVFYNKKITAIPNVVNFGGSVLNMNPNYGNQNINYNFGSRINTGNNYNIGNSMLAGSDPDNYIFSSGVCLGKQGKGSNIYGSVNLGYSNNGGVNSYYKKYQ